MLKPGVETAWMMLIVFDNLSSHLPPCSLFTSTVTPRPEVTNIAISVTNGSFENTTRKWTFIPKEIIFSPINLSKSRVCQLDCLVSGGIVTVDLPESPFLIVLWDSAF